MCRSIRTSRDRIAPSPQWSARRRPPLPHHSRATQDGFREQAWCDRPRHSTRNGSGAPVVATDCPAGCHGAALRPCAVRNGGSASRPGLICPVRVGEGRVGADSAACREVSRGVIASARSGRRRSAAPRRLPMSSCMPRSASGRHPLLRRVRNWDSASTRRWRMRCTSSDKPRSAAGAVIGDSWGRERRRPSAQSDAKNDPARPACGSPSSRLRSRRAPEQPAPQPPHECGEQHAD